MRIPRYPERIPDTASWAHDEFWDQSTYTNLISDWLTREPATLALLAISPAAAPDIHSDEWNMSLLHALAILAGPWCPPF